VPLRFPRPVMALIATGAAAVSICLSAMPASADQFRGANSADLAGAVTNVAVTAVALAAPPAPRASAGALPREAPAGAPPSSSAQSIGTQILRSAEISGALLLCLLLLIVAYAAMGRRRRRDGPAVAAEWMHRPGQSRYPHAGSDADRMLELFAAPAAPPMPPVALRGPAVRSERYGPPPAGGGVFSPATGREPSAPAGHRFGGPATGGPTAADASDSSGWLSHGPASRAVDRRAPVSGVPPWEPAAAPAGELPWATAPGRHAGGPPADGSARPAPTYGADLGYDPAGRAGQFDPEPRNPEPRMGGYGPPPGATPPGGYRSPPSSGVPADPSAAWGYRSPTGSGAPSDSHARPDYSPPADRTPPVGYGADAAEPRFAPSGLPVRQPQESWPPGSAPSPSGSLWEPASRDASQASEPTEYPDQSYDEVGRPIFVWDRAMRRDPWQASSGE
jgi:hypothetical protein